MSDTYKNEHRTDGFHKSSREERTARQPQRGCDAFAADLALDSESA